MEMTEFSEQSDGMYFEDQKTDRGNIRLGCWIPSGTFRDAPTLAQPSSPVGAQPAPLLSRLAGDEDEDENPQNSVFSLQFPQIRLKGRRPPTIGTIQDPQIRLVDQSSAAF